MGGYPCNLIDISDIYIYIYIYIYINMYIYIYIITPMHTSSGSSCDSFCPSMPRHYTSASWWKAS